MLKRNITKTYEFTLADVEAALKKYIAEVFSEQVDGATVNFKYRIKEAFDFRDPPERVLCGAEVKIRK